MAQRLHKEFVVSYQQRYQNSSTQVWTEKRRLEAEIEAAQRDVDGLRLALEQRTAERKGRFGRLLAEKRAKLEETDGRLRSAHEERDMLEKELTWTVEMTRKQKRAAAEEEEKRRQQTAPVLTLGLPSIKRQVNPTPFVVASTVDEDAKQPSTSEVAAPDDPMESDCAVLESGVDHHQSQQHEVVREKQARMVVEEKNGGEKRPSQTAPVMSLGLPSIQRQGNAAPLTAATTTSVNDDMRLPPTQHEVIREEKKAEESHRQVVPIQSVGLPSIKRQDNAAPFLSSPVKSTPISQVGGAEQQQMRGGDFGQDPNQRQVKNPVGPSQNPQGGETFGMFLGGVGERGNNKPERGEFSQLFGSQCQAQTQVGHGGNFKIPNW